MSPGTRRCVRRKAAAEALEKELTRAILDGRLPDGAHVTAREDGEGGIALDVLAGAPRPVAA